MIIYQVVLRWEISWSRLMICIMGLNVDADAVTGNSEQVWKSLAYNSC